jgi:hypothetical protein
MSLRDCSVALQAHNGIFYLEVQMTACFIALTDSGAIRANVVYQKVGTAVCGCYMGYAGGGITDFRFFSIDEAGEIKITDDEGELDEDCLAISESLTQKRNEFIDWDASDDGNLSSEVGKAFASAGDSKSSGIRYNFTDNFDFSILNILEECWSLTYRFSD